MVAEYKDLKESVVGEVIEVGEKDGLFKVSGKKIEYLTVKKSYNITDPEEQVRVSFYYELIKKYQYPRERIDLEVIVPRREPTDKADILVYEDDEKKKPYIVVECKKDGIPQAEIKQAIEQAFGNANSLRSKYTILVAGNVRIAFDVANFSPKEREKNIIADIPVRYGKVIKFKYKKGDPQWDLRDVTRDELLAKFQQCHDTLWEGGKRNPAEAFDEMSKLMYCKIQDERFLTKKGEHYKFQVGTYETINEVAERIRKIYKDAQEIDPEVFIESIKADNPIIYTVAEILQGISLARTDLDVKGEGYEHFLGGVFRGAMGQYFTPRPIVRFMIDFLEPSIDDFIVDPACGSGGFLIYTLERMRKELFAKLDEKDAAYRWQDFALKQVYGIEINSQLARVSMMNMIIHEDGHTNIENADALDNPNNWKRQKIREYFSKKFTLLLTNPPFGASVKEREKPYLANYELGGKLKRRNRQNTEILFIERCLDFLKTGGRMGIVLPDGILTNSSLQYVRDFVNEKAQILGVVSLPQTAFKRPASKGSGESGSGVKASLLFLRKKREGEKSSKDYPIFMAIAEHIGYDATGRPDKDEFPDVLKAWGEFRKTNRTSFFVKAPLCFAVGRGEMEGRWEPSFYRPEFRQQIDALKLNKYPLINLGEVIESIRYGTSSPPKYADAGIPFIRATNIKDGHIIQDDMKFMTPEETKNFEKCRLKEDDIIIVRSGVNTGDCARITKEFNNAYAAYDLILDLKSSVNSEYINVFLNLDLGKLQILRVKARSAQPHLNANEVKSLRFPFPPREIQDKIVSIMDEAYKTKEKKESEAENLSTSIKTYVLEQLGIDIPEVEGKSPKVFSVAAEILKGERIDPFYYEPRYKAIDEAFKKSRYAISTLGEHIEEIRYGASVKNIYVKDGIPLLRISNLRPNEIDLSDIVRLPKEKEKEIGNCYVKEGDFLISRSGTLGITAIVPKEADGFAYGSFMIRFNIRQSELNPFYLCIIMNSEVVKEQISRRRIGAIQGNITIPAIKSLSIPLPPLFIQEKIVNEVHNRKEKVKRLKKEAKELLEKAKREVEEFIEKK
jgi:type I restriction enzyme M protein